jgi:hypothetical protein
LNPHALTDPAIAYQRAGAYIASGNFKYELYIIAGGGRVRGTNEQAAKSQDLDHGNISFALMLPGYKLALGQFYSNVSAYFVV